MRLRHLGDVFRTSADGVGLRHGYRQWCGVLLQRLRGMFAFVIWDSREQKLFGARDIFGIKPFYYYQHNGDFFYGSEIKSFLAHPNFVKELNEERLPEYLCYEYVTDGETRFRHVYKLIGGHCFNCTQGKLTNLARRAHHYTPTAEPTPCEG